jgi:hypothetical protein
LKINLSVINQKKSELENHSLLVTNSIQSKDDLRLFMSTHVYAVWDFMSLLKTLQHEVVPSGKLWYPTKGTRSNIARLINEIVLCEESDINLGGHGAISHFDLYLQCMLEVGVDIAPVNSFLNNIKSGVHPSNAEAGANRAAREFMKNTFDIIERGPHCVAASFAYGRETVIPNMFKNILNQLQFTRLSAPKFYYYLDRHIEVDSGEHGPASEQLIEYFCNDDPQLIYEAEIAAIDSINARIKLWDAVELQLL